MVSIEGEVECSQTSSQAVHEVVIPSSCQSSVLSIVSIAPSDQVVYQVVPSKSPIKFNHIKSSPVKSSPIKSSPVKSCPVPSSQVPSSPIPSSSPVKSNPTKSIPIRSHKVQSHQVVSSGPIPSSPVPSRPTPSSSPLHHVVTSSHFVKLCIKPPHHIPRVDQTNPTKLTTSGCQPTELSTVALCDFAEQSMNFFTIDRTCLR